MDDKIRLAIKIAREWKSCPHCSISMEGMNDHYCKNCHERVSLPIMVPFGFIQKLRDIRDSREEEEKGGK